MTSQALLITVCSILPEGLQQSREGQEGPTAPTGAGAAVSEVSSSEAFREQCADTGGLCIIAALDATSADFEAQKTMFQVQFQLWGHCFNPEMLLVSCI